MGVYLSVSWVLTGGCEHSAQLHLEAGLLGSCRGYVQVSIRRVQVLPACAHQPRHAGTELLTRIAHCRNLLPFTVLSTSFQRPFSCILYYASFYQ